MKTILGHAHNQCIHGTGWELCSLYFQTITMLNKKLNKKISVLPGLHHRKDGRYLFAVQMKPNVLLILQWDKNNYNKGGVSYINDYNIKRRMWGNIAYSLQAEKLMRTISYSQIKKLKVY